VFFQQKYAVQPVYDIIYKKVWVSQPILPLRKGLLLRRVYHGLMAAVPGRALTDDSKSAEGAATFHWHTREPNCIKDLKAGILVTI
jgi:hypothetical protein